MKLATVCGKVIDIEGFRYNSKCTHSHGVSLNTFSEDVPVYNCDSCMASLTVDEVKLIYGDNQQPAGQDKQP